MVAIQNQPRTNVLIKPPIDADSLGIYVSIASPNPSDIALINRFSLQCYARKILPDFSIQKCHKWIIPRVTNADGQQELNRREVDIYVSQQSGKAFYGNLVTCKSIWVCPVCASKISERRRVELTDGLIVSRDCGHHHLLASYTVSHHMGDSLEYVANGMNDAFRRLKSGKSWKLFKQRWGWIGDIKSTEITYGENGWHFHFHQLIILDQKPSPHNFGKFQSELKTRWLSALNQRQHYASWSHGLDIRPTDDAIADYVEKVGNWTVEHELTKQSVKQGKRKGRTPAQILIDYAADGTIDDADLFREYAKLTYRKNQLYWSKGLRQLLELGEERTDDELMDEKEESAILLATLDEDEWAILNNWGLRGHALSIARKAYSEENLTIWSDWLEMVKRSYFSHSEGIVIGE